MIRRWRRERDALGGTLDPYYPRHPPDPYTGHLPDQVESSGAQPAPDELEPEAPRPPRVGIGSRITNRLAAWRRAWLPLPDEIIEEYLGHGERMIHNDHPSLRAFFIEHGLLMLALFVAVGVFIGVVLNGSTTAILLSFVLLAIVSLILVLKRLSERYTSYVITNVRIMRVAGVVTRRVHSIPWMRVTDLSFDQNWLGRMLGYATLHIESANEDSGLRDLAGVSKPMVFNKYLVDMVVAKQGPIAPGWEELGQAGPAGVLAVQQRVGLRDRVREIRRRRRRQRGPEDERRFRWRAGSEGTWSPGGPGGGRGGAGGPGGSGGGRGGGESGPYRDPRRVYVSDDEATRRFVPGDADRDRGPRRGDASSGYEGPDPLREGPEAGLPWGRDRD